MVDGLEQEDTRQLIRRPQSESPTHDTDAQALEASPGATLYPTSLWSDPALRTRGNQPVDREMMLHMQQTFGNRAVQRFLHHAERGVTKDPLNPSVQRWEAARLDSREQSSADGQPVTPDSEFSSVPAQPTGPGRVQRIAAAGQGRVRPALMVQRELMNKTQWQQLTGKLGLFGTRGEKNPVLLKIDSLLDAYPRDGTKPAKEAALGKLSIVRDWLERTRGDNKNKRRAALQQLYQNILDTYRDENISVPEGVHVEQDAGRHPELHSESHYAAEVAMAPTIQDVDAKWTQFQKETPPDLIVMELKSNLSKLLDLDPPLTGGALDEPTKAAIKAYKQRLGLANPDTGNVTKALLTSLSEEKKRKEQAPLKAGLGQATQELQNKLNSSLGLNPPLTSGVFDAATETAIKSFKQRFALPNPDSADLDTRVWQELDARGRSDVGQARIKSTENLGGQIAGATANFLWAVHADRLEITVKISFDIARGAATGRRGAVVTACKDAISNVWNNKFRIVNTANADGLDLKFVVQDLQDQEGGDINKIVLSDGDGRSDAGNWYMDDSRLYVSTAAHEFGHLLGLEDEYQRTHADYKRVVGAEPVEGASKMTNAQARDCAQKLHQALSTASTRDEAAEAYEKALKVLKDFKLLNKEGTGLAVVRAYTELYNADLVNRIGEIKGKFGKAAESTMLGKGSFAMSADSAHSRLVEPFTFESPSLMGAGGNVSEHNHGVEPRHVRHLVDYVRQSKGGTWDIKPK